MIGVKKIIHEEDKALLDKIRSLFIESGGKPLYEPEDYGIGRETSDNARLRVTYGNPDELLTKRGKYHVTGSCVCCDADIFFGLLEQHFNVVMIHDVLSGAMKESSSGYTVELMPTL